MPVTRWQFKDLEESLSNMANIADGYICINSKNSDLLTDLKTQIKEKTRCFSYGGPVDIMEGEIDGLPYIEAIFSGRWSCEDAWIFFEQLMADSKYPFKDALIDSTMSGSESEGGSRYAAKISKSSGEQIITRKDTSDEKDWDD